MNKTSKLELISCIVVMGFFAAVLFHYIVGAYLKHPYPMNTFLCEADKSIAFSDFHAIYRQAKTFSPYSASDALYFPFAYIPCFFLVLLPEKIALGLFLIISVVFFLYFCKYFFNNTYFERNVFTNRITNLKNIFILSVLTYPVLFCFERGNLEWFVFIFMCLFLICYTQKRFYLSAFFLACATAMKGYTSIFVFLFLTDKHYKEAFSVCVIAALLTLASMLSFKSSIPQQLLDLQKNYAWLKVFFIKNDRALCFNATLFSLTKTVSHVIHGVHWSNTAESSDTKIFIYSIGAGITLLIILLDLFLFEKTLWKKIAILSICGQLLPQISLDYHLIQMYLPLFLFVNAKEHGKNDIWYTLIFGLFLIPKNYHMLYGSYGTGNFFNTLLLLAFLGLIIFENLSPSYLNPFSNRPAR